MALAEKTSAIHFDEHTISEFSKIFQTRDNVRGRLHSIDPITKKKNQSEEKLSFDAASHLNGTIQQGGYAATDKGCKFQVWDIDKSIPAKELCKTIFNLDPSIFPIQSPGGRWHLFKFHHDWLPLDQAKKIAAAVEKKLERIYGKDLDKGHTLPLKQGWINFPYVHGTNRVCYDPRGNPLSLKQFIHRYRFKNHALIAAMVGLSEGGRHKAMFSAALYCEHVLKDMRHLEEINKNFDKPIDQKDINRFTVGEYHLSNEKWSKDYLLRNINNYLEEINGYKPAAAIAAEAVEAPIKRYRLLDPNYSPHVRAFDMESYLKKDCMTLNAGEPGSAKTTFLGMKAYCFASGHTFFGKKVLNPGNALIITAEEDRNEMELRLRAIDQQYGGIKNGNHIACIGYDTNLKLVNFSKDDYQKTKQCYELEQIITEHNYKFIGLDPLISMQKGAFDENNNPQMDAFCKSFLIPLAQKFGACVSVNHHTNKISMITEGGMIDNNALHAARGASALVGAARIVIGLSPMTRQLWEKEYKKVVKEDEFKHLVAIIDAKNNYSALGNKPKWLQKKQVFVDCKDGQEPVAILTETNISELMDSRSAMSQEYARKEISKHLPVIDGNMKADPHSKVRMVCTLHAVATELANKDPRISNEKEKTLAMEYRRMLQSGMPENRPILFNGFYYWYEYDRYATSKAVHKLHKQDKESYDTPKFNL